MTRGTSNIVAAVSIFGMLLTLMIGFAVTSSIVMISSLVVGGIGAGVSLASRH